MLNIGTVIKPILVFVKNIPFSSVIQSWIDSKFNKVVKIIQNLNIYLTFKCAC